MKAKSSFEVSCFALVAKVLFFLFFGGGSMIVSKNRQTRISKPSNCLEMSTLSYVDCQWNGFETNKFFGLGFTILSALWDQTKPLKNWNNNKNETLEFMGKLDEC